MSASTYMPRLEIALNASRNACIVRWDDLLTPYTRAIFAYAETRRSYHNSVGTQTVPGRR